ncbi:hypothetical protein [Nonomuraea jabiensis]|uniref:Uncharacterized protein n=1 Tax=Nonomuraea jabiensis TaxID=882448 RepID=A0A7W9FYM9_9ACTN|nr:hypothetical protein [Nonomuraea jabiensis]MBB5773963.1 hypothetical protein [Nonomuraea jabiensis]
MNAEIDRYEKGLAKRHVTSKRHMIQVDCDDYMLTLRKERAAG